MDISKHLDPELAIALGQLPPELLDMSSLENSRALLNSFIDASRMHPDTPVSIENRVIRGADDHPELVVRVYRPKHLEQSCAALLWIHGGGLVMGSCDMSDQSQANMALNGKCLVISVEYRLAPQTIFPGALEDCYAALKWLYVHAVELGVNPERIAVGGASAGGGLAAAVALLARDRGEVPVFWQFLLYPMLDDRNCTRSSHVITDKRFWNRELNLQGWRDYLGVAPGSPDVSPYAAPARAVDLEDLPETFIAIGSLDLFLDESVDYAKRLLEAGVATELHVYAGAFHGSEGMIPQAKISQRMQHEIDTALQQKLGA